MMIEEELYRDTILEAAQNPKNKGEISKPDLEAKLVNPACGDEIRLQLKLSNNQEPRTNNQTVRRAVFSGNGCAISQATASLLAENIEGKKLDKIKSMKSDDILRLVGITPNPSRMGCVLLSLEVLKEVIRDKR